MRLVGTFDPPAAPGAVGTVARVKERGLRAPHAIAAGAIAIAVLVGSACGAEPRTDTETAATAPADQRPRVGAALGVVDATYTFHIPLDAGAQMASGAVVDILPGSLDARVGESIRIVNDDRQGHTVGPWYVGPHETLTQEFTSAGVFEGQCTVHSSGEFVLQVTDA